ncbi:glycosyl hydrolases family 31-domain-containing protein [Butyriboletus roseoflavus]|nr:glycosyl hydrolases family 31-domain-containing protein [Butyriboletus roseoflavus]
MDLAQHFHDKQVNVSVIVVDFFNWKYQGDWSFDPEYWPDPALMAQTVKNLTGAETMVSLWPSVEDLSDNYLALQEQGFLATTRDGTGISDLFAGVYTRLYDSTNPGASGYCGSSLTKFTSQKASTTSGLTKSVAAAPRESPSKTVGVFLSLQLEDTLILIIIDGQVINLIPYARAFSQYFIGTQEAPLLAANVIVPTCGVGIPSPNSMSFHNKSLPACRLPHLAYLHEPSISVALMGWTLTRNMQGARVVREMAGSRVCNITSPSTPTYANNCPNEPWLYGEQNFEIIKQYISLRYQLAPYVKTLFEMLQATGRSIMRPLYYDFSLSDPFVAQATGANDPLVVHQFMFGPRLLVSPVGVQGATSKQVSRLPASMQGMTWIHWSIPVHPKRFDRTAAR